MTKYTSLETSRKLYEAFPEWEKPKDGTEMHWITDIDHPTPFVFDNCCWREYEDYEYICPAFDTDYLLEKLSAMTDHVSVQRSNKISIDASNGEKSNWYAHCWLKSRRMQVKSDTPAESLALLALELKKEGIL